MQDATATLLRDKLGDLYDALNLAHIARTYFDKSRAWLYHRINGNIVNGKPARFTPEEEKEFYRALDDIRRQIEAFTRYAQGGTVRVIIERGSDGKYGAYIDGNNPLPFGVIGDGATVEEAKQNFLEGVDEFVKKDGYELPDGVAFEFVVDAQCKEH